MTTSSSSSVLAHLYRRAGFGATPSELKAAEKLGFSATVDELLAGLTENDRAGDALKVPYLTPLAQASIPGFEYDDYDEFMKLSSWWLDRMIVSDTPLREKLVLLLHNQFPTSYAKVNSARPHVQPERLFRKLGAGSFETLTQAVAEGPGDADLARHRHGPQGPTPTRTSPGSSWSASPWASATTPKRTFGRRRGVHGLGARLHDGGVLLQPLRPRQRGEALPRAPGSMAGPGHRPHRHAHEGLLEWVVARLWSFLAYPVTPEVSIVAELAPKYKRDLNVAGLLEAILRHPEFVSATAMKGLIKQPIEYLVGTLRLLGLTTAAFGEGTLVWLLSSLGQQPFVPLNVGGWGQNEYWLSTSPATHRSPLAWASPNTPDLTEVET